MLNMHRDPMLNMHMDFTLHRLMDPSIPLFPFVCLCGYNEHVGHYVEIILNAK